MCKTQRNALALALFLAILPSTALAGMANADLRCQGQKDGSKVLLVASIPGDLPDFEVELQYGEKNFQLGTSKAASIQSRNSQKAFSL